MGVWSALRCRSTWSALGPHGIGNRWSSAGTSGHSAPEEAAGHRAFPRTTTAVEAARKRLRSPPPQPPSIQLTTLERAASTSRQSCHVDQNHHRRLVWFERAGRWGTTTPVTRDSPSIQGDVPGPDPARAPPSKAVAGGARLSGAAGGGLPCLGKVRDAARRCPPSGRAWSTFGPHAIGTQRFVTVMLPTVPVWVPDPGWCRWGEWLGS
jgi:hypothetical protein